jgi:ubiquinone/menaquinone biosynthesis C-methylase UbiE
METNSEETRKVYQSIHEKGVADEQFVKRLHTRYKERTYTFDKKWFVGKECLDAGCGNLGSLIIGLLSLVVQKVYAVDIGSDWIEKLRNVLEKHNVLESSYELEQGDVRDIPYEDERFDFVSINGVLIHLSSMAEIIRGFSEGARVCRKQGYFHTSYASCGGVMQGVIFPALRQYYKENTEFREFVDNLNPGILHEAINKICADTKKHTGETFDSHQLKSLFGEEFCLFIKNYLQAPTCFRTYARLN